MCFLCIAIAFAYKVCTFFEIQYVEKEECSDWARYEIVPAFLAEIEVYRFWWMFATRNIVDRIIPFFALVLMNFFIIIGLKEDQRKTSTIKGAPVVNMDNGRGSVKVRNVS
ncbi:hypothetical protein L596_022405 [Steinernema carpocapsae]|uniref:Bestrophin homolog n=1 Tax=Steinernema carpocapsae TaxID=34508 RepID=A0A4U5MLM3_STECR|nr:hypothetical protein L596_022405 [Steinernema carpocapsae]